MKKIIACILIIFIIIFIVIYNYNIKLNNSIEIVYQEVKIDNISEYFNGFKVLQITDLHSKFFGDNQKDLIEKINSIDYDLLAITGDMISTIDINDLSPLTDILDGIDNKNFIFYIKGNQGPEVIDGATGEVTEIGQVLIENGCNLLLEPFPIKIGDSTLWVSEFLNNDMYNSFDLAINENDIRIAITHYPRSENFYENIAKYVIPKYDLVIAGHYHGGQWRIPLVGALFIPDINGDGRSVFPKQEAVSGLTTWGRYNQYVSRGLGASGNKFLRFRLFNKPEINVITLVG